MEQFCNVSVFGSSLGWSLLLLLLLSCCRTTMMEWHNRHLFIHSIQIICYNEYKLRIVDLQDEWRPQYLYDDNWIARLAPSCGEPAFIRQMTVAVLCLCVWCAPVFPVYLPRLLYVCMYAVLAHCQYWSALVTARHISAFTFTPKHNIKLPCPTLIIVSRYFFFRSPTKGYLMICKRPDSC